MHTVWPEVRSSRIPARVKTPTSSDHRGGYRAGSPAAGALRRLRVCMDYTSIMWSFDMSIIFSFSFTFGCPSCSGPGLCPFFLKKSIICIFCGACSVSLDRAGIVYCLICVCGSQVHPVDQLTVTDHLECTVTAGHFPNYPL